jgi:subtilisin family serine protease
MREITAWPIAPLHMHCAVLEIPAGADRAAVLAALTQDRRVRIAQPLQTFATQTSGYDDPYVGLQRGFQKIDVPNAHPWSRGEGVRIAIIDTGADDLHPDLRGVIVEMGNFVDSDVGQFRRDRHGTELAGVIAAVANNREGIVGIAPGARLSIFKACWQLRDDQDSARCNSYTLARALTAALDSHAQVVNLSLAGPADPLLRQLIQEGLRRGILFVGAAPPEMVKPEDPLLQFDGVIEVAGDGILGGPGAPLRAPGREILTLLPGGHYDFASGTSLATAHVTGIVALLLAKNSKLTGAAVYQLLRNTTVHVDAGGDDSVDACGAVTALIGHGLCHNGTPAASRVAMH